ncbi:PilC/PilY family type IV pilus protein [Stenotrophomonas sp. PS02301]|uniref:pilus assembly protein n=1 Tax=Stenotrophomonas sp. PS02301 TaxID=2991427 RepID=UPI00249A7CF9|nr:PilC/PilY family type IV pilus protein [Stenotrophomonas sp. PS02301]
MSPTRRMTSIRRAAGFVVLATLLPGSWAAVAAVAQAPLESGIKVPGNLVLVPSVEFPTIISAANLGDYVPTTRYVGYFDPDKCYRYHYAATEPDRHFAPVGARTSAGCPGKAWDGRFLNWAATQTIDPFRKALTGGYRVRDTDTETWLEKADFSVAARSANFPTRRLPAAGSIASQVHAATPATWGYVHARVHGLGARMFFTGSGPIDSAATATAYNPDDLRHPLTDGPGGDMGQVYEVSVRVKVCDASVGLEDNCQSYARAAKPEGLLQAYSDRLRFSIFGYINNGGPTPQDQGGYEVAPDGGVLRARQKFIGPIRHDPFKPTANPNVEWDTVTGVQKRNPDPADAAATGGGMVDSGVINYLNKFGQMNTGRTPKYHDNVSELYYAALRYLRGIGNVASYSQLSGDAITRRRQADGFPVIQTWDDPIQYSCQSNVLLGIGDTNTWNDKNLPGPTSTVGETWSKPQAVAGDTGFDVVKAMTQIFRMEGMSAAAAASKAQADWFNGSAGQSNSAYIAALAYLAHTTDLRPDDLGNGMRGLQTASTYWVDVVEKGDYKIGANQYVLAAKYGGFTVPAGFDAFAPAATPLSLASWWRSGDYVNGDRREPRPDTFYAASDATRMVDSLKQAFESIVQDKRGSASALATGAGSADGGDHIYAASYQSGSWRGDVAAHAVDVNTGTIQAQASWSAAAMLDARPWRQRTLRVERGGGLVELSWSALGPAAQHALGDSRVLDYLAGDRSNEGKDGFRARASVLGDIVNSAPVYVGAANARLYAGRQFAGARQYGAFVRAQQGRRAVVYVGANDGFLHGFDAATGAETLAFLPAAAIGPALRDYTREEYEHRYSVDGELTVADAYVNGAWRTVLVGTMGRGGRGVFALDVTDPDQVSLLWQHDARALPGMGASVGKPLVGQIADGDWRVVLGNGPDSADGVARLFTLALGSGTLTVQAPGTAGGNGMSAPRLWDADRDGFAETAYAGDLHGNLYRFSLIEGRSERLFTAVGHGAAQPITAAPLVAQNPADGGTWVFFGTGALLQTQDLADASLQSWYGLRDRGQPIAGRTGLKATRILAETDNGRAIEKNDAPGVDGWVLDLQSPGHAPAGERMIVASQFRGRVLVGTTRIPDPRDPCAPGGSGYLMAIDPFTGGRLDESFFDLDGDGMVGGPGDLVDADGTPVPSSGYLVGQGPNGPAFIGDWLGVSLQDGSNTGVVTRPIGNIVRRVGWREILWMGSDDK